MTHDQFLTYDPATVRELPRLRVARTLRTRDFDTASHDLRHWAIQQSFFRVATEAPLEVGTVVALRIPLTRLVFRCKVTSLIDEPTRCGFTYGTLPGHLECGEESFVVKRDPDGSLRVTIEAFSEPATWWLRAIRPLVNLARQVITRVFYLRALDQCSRSSSISSSLRRSE